MDEYETLEKELEELYKVSNYIFIYLSLWRLIRQLPILHDNMSQASINF